MVIFFSNKIGIGVFFQQIKERKSKTVVHSCHGWAGLKFVKQSP
jgi:hypothetical protein